MSITIGRAVLRWLEYEFGDVVSAKGGAEQRVNCPFCPIPDTKHHLYVSMRKPVAHCFRCDWSGSHFDMIREVTDADSYAEIWKILKSPKTVADYKTVAEQLVRCQEYEVLEHQILSMPLWFSTFKDNHASVSAKMILKYALKRVDMNTVVDYNFGYCKDMNSIYRMRLIIPVERGFFQARAINPGSAVKYLSPSLPVGDRLFNYNALSMYEHVFICEGIFSAIALGNAAVAVLGKSANDEQMRRLASSDTTAFTIAFDADTQFSDGVNELAKYLSAHDKCVRIREYVEGDPDSCNEFNEIEYDLKYRILCGFHN